MAADGDVVDVAVLTEALKNMGVLTVADIEDALIEREIPKSKRLIRRLCKNLPRCRCCPFVAGTRPELIKHMKKEGHWYGQDKFKEDVMLFKERLSIKLGVDLALKTFGELGEYENDMIQYPEIKAHYDNIVDIQLFLIKVAGERKG